MVKNQIEYCRNGFVRLVDNLISWRNRSDPNKVNEQDKRLTTQVVFTAAIVKIPLTCLSYLGLLSLCVRLCALSLGLSALESSFERERAAEQGVTRYSRSPHLSRPFVFSLSFSPSLALSLVCSTELKGRRGALTAYSKTP